MTNTTIYLSVLLLIDFWIVSRFWLLVPQWIYFHICFRMENLCISVRYQLSSFQNLVNVFLLECWYTFWKNIARDSERCFHFFVHVEKAKGLCITQVVAEVQSARGPHYPTNLHIYLKQSPQCEDFQRESPIFLVLGAIRLRSTYEVQRIVGLQSCEFSDNKAASLGLFCLDLALSRPLWLSSKVLMVFLVLLY